MGNPMTRIKILMMLTIIISMVAISSIKVTLIKPD